LRIEYVKKFSLFKQKVKNKLNDMKQQRQTLLDQIKQQQDMINTMTEEMNAKDDLIQEYRQMITRYVDQSDQTTSKHPTTKRDHDLAKRPFGPVPYITERIIPPTMLSNAITNGAHREIEIFRKLYILPYKRDELNLRACDINRNMIQYYADGHWQTACCDYVYDVYVHSVIAYYKTHVNNMIYDFNEYKNMSEERGLTLRESIAMQNAQTIMHHGGDHIGRLRSDDRYRGRMRKLIIQEIAKVRTLRITKIIPVEEPMPIARIPRPSNRLYIAPNQTIKIDPCLPDTDSESDS